jgi:two-component system chemotaxis response regulator CheB
VLARSTDLPVALAAQGEPLVAGQVRVAVPDLHLVVEDGAVALVDGPKENRQRPAVDPLLRSAARWYGSHTLAVVLSGALDDGAVGAAIVRHHGGTVFVQDPDDAQVPSMPVATLAAVPDADVAPATELGKRVSTIMAGLVQRGTRRATAADDDLGKEEAVTRSEGTRTPASEGLGSPTGLGCPDCSGGMYELTTGNLVHYRCHTGHAWSPLTLLQAERDAAEDGLLAAAAKFREEAVVLRGLAELAARQLDDETSRRHREAAYEADQRALTVHRLLRRLSEARAADQDVET